MAIGGCVMGFLGFKKWLFCGLILLAPLCLATSGKKVIDEHTFRDVAGELRCPTCTGLSVLDSDAKFSVQIKDEVRAQLESGVSKEKILEFFEQRYGPWILRKPPHKGFNAIVWWIPISLLVCGPLLIWFFVWRKRKVISSYGVRDAQSIIEEMKSMVEQTKKAKGS